MKFPKSMHAEGWANHIDTTPTGKSKASAAPLHAAKRGARPLTGGTRMDLEPPVVAPSLAITPPVPPRAEPRPAAATRPQAEAVMRPADSDQKMPWVVAAAGGAAIIGGLAFWAFNRPDAPAMPPAIVGSTEPQTQVAAAMPEPPPAADRDTAEVAPPAVSSTAAEPAAAPAPLGLPVTTVKPAAEPRQVAQAPVPAARPDLVLRGNPTNPSTPAPEHTPYLQPVQPTAPVAEAQPPVVTPGAAPITAPPAAAGPATAPAQPQAMAPQQPAQTAPAPVSMPEPAIANSMSPGTPTPAQAAVPTPEDSGITVKVRSALAADSTLAAVAIAVSTDHGVVKLEGQAPDAPTRERAAVVAASAAGVKAVDNRLTLPSVAVSLAPTSGNL